MKKLTDKQKARLWDEQQKAQEQMLADFLRDKERERLANAGEYLFENLCEALKDPAMAWETRRVSGVIIGLYEPKGDLLYSPSIDSLSTRKLPFFQRRTLRRLIKNRIAYNALKRLEAK